MLEGAASVRIAGNESHAAAGNSGTWPSQCKRYRGSVGPGAVRDFRGAMADRGDKGLLITTGSFTADAKEEAIRDGAPPIDLIDGDRLCELLKKYDLGVRTATRTVEDVTIDAAFSGEILVACCPAWPRSGPGARNRGGAGGVQRA